MYNFCQVFVVPFYHYGGGMWLLKSSYNLVIVQKDPNATTEQFIVDVNILMD